MWGCSPHAPGNMGCCIPSDALAGIEKVQKTLKNCLESLGNRRRDFCDVGANAAPTPRQWQSHSHCALRAMPMQLRKGKQALRLKMRCCFFFFYCFFLRRKGITWDATSHVAEGVGEQPHKINTRISTRAKRNLGLNALRLRGGMGAAQAPISCHILCKPAQTLCRRGTIGCKDFAVLRG